MHLSNKIVFFLIHEWFHNIRIDFSVQTIEIFFQVLIAVFKDKNQFFITVENIIKTYNILVFQLLQQTYFTQSRRRNTLKTYSALKNKHDYNSIDIPHRHHRVSRVSTQRSLEFHGFWLWTPYHKCLLMLIK